MSGLILRRALRVVAEREGMYGPPSEHWKRTAALASALLAAKLRPGEAVTAHDWGLLMVLEKASRSLGPDAGLDQLVDIAGYADGLGRLEGSDEQHGGHA